MELFEANAHLESVLNAVCNGEIKSSEILRAFHDYTHRCKQAALVEIAIDWLEIAAKDYESGNCDPRNEKEFKRAHELINSIPW